MLSKRDRYFVRHRLLLKPRRGVGAAIPLVAQHPQLSAVSLLADAIRKRAAALKLAGGDVVRITHIEHRDKENMVVVLFRRRNPNASTQVFEDHQEAIREADRKPTEDPAVSAHLFIHAAQHRGDVISHRAIMEEVPGLGASYMRSLLDDVVKSFEYDAKDKRGADVKTATKVEMFGVPSQSLKDSIAKNGFEFIELIREPDLEGLDTEGLNVKPERLRIYPARSQKGTAGKFSRVVDWAGRNQWDSISVSVREQDKTKVVRLDREAEAATVLFVRSDLVQVGHDIPSCGASVHEGLAAEAVKMFADNASWT